MGGISALPGLDVRPCVVFGVPPLFSVPSVVRSSVNGRHKGLCLWVDPVTRRQNREACPQ